MKCKCIRKFELPNEMGVYNLIIIWNVNKAKKITQEQKDIVYNLIIIWNVNTQKPVNVLKRLIVYNLIIIWNVNYHIK